MLRPARSAFSGLALVAAATCGLNCASNPPPGYDLHHDLRVELGFDAEGASAIKLDLAVPFSELVFERRDDGTFASRLRLRVLVLDQDGRQSTGQVWTESIVVATAAGTRSGTDWLQKRYALRVQPGKQRVLVSVEVVGTNRQRSSERWIDVPESPLGALRLGEVQFWQQRAAAPAEAELVPNPAATYRRGSGDPHVRCEVQDPLGGDSVATYEVAFRVVDESEHVVLLDSLRLESNRARFELRLDLRVQALYLGGYKLELVVRRGTRRAETSAVFDLGFAALTWGGNLRETLDMLALVLPPGDVDSLRQAPPQAREARWRALWARSDPDPATSENEFMEEVFERVRFANARFAGREPGWRSDRGRIYVRFGRPSQVDRLGDRASAGAVERWTYARGNRVFVFVDADGRGDYVLERSNEPWRP